MYNQPFFIPSYQMTRLPLNLARTATTTRGGLGIINRLGGVFSGLKNINWGGLINNTSKTLGIINQTIPLVRQVGPMMTNMKSMLKIASVFKDETDKTPIKTKTSKKNFNQTPSTSKIISNEKPQLKEKETINYENNPTFFINS